MRIAGVEHHQPKPAPTAPARALTPEAMFERVAPCFAAAGLTRVADITGLDWVGIPVWTAVRPNSYSLAVSQGKGATAAEARIGAVMESLESFVAERPALPVRVASYRELCAAGVPCVDPRRLVRVRQVRLDLERPLRWTVGVDLIAGGERWVPLQTVELDLRLPAAEEPLFLRISSGLASGSCLLEALYHALTELVERDAWTLFLDTMPIERWPEHMLDLATIDDPLCRDLLARLEAAGMEVTLVEVTADIALPCMAAWLRERRPRFAASTTGYFFGSGCHHNPYHAMARALTEAVQGRLTLIAGARDDITRQRYEHNRSRLMADPVAALGRAPGRVSGPRRDARAMPQRGLASVEQDVARALALLAGVGCEQAVLVELAHPAVPISVARLVVPGLEGAFHYGTATRGERHARFTRLRARGPTGGQGGS